jgi:FSR family fosmidomycin resistance protein-like MFS transporter
MHALVDAYSQVVTPLWPSLTREFDLSPWGLTLLFGAWQLATSISQPFFGFWGDRFGSRWMVALGPAGAVICLCLLGLSPNAIGLALLLVMGGLGIGAFHPEAAAGVVEASGTKLTTGLSLFTFGGMVGLSIGPVVSGLLARHYGTPGLLWALLPGLLIVGTLVLVRQPSLSHVPAAGEPVATAEILNGRGLSALLLLLVATLRVVPALGIPLCLAFVLDQQDQSPAAIGGFQSLFLLSGGLGTLICPRWAQPGRELSALVGSIVPGTLCLALLAWNPGPAVYYLGLVGSGFFLQGAIPILIAYSQRLMPRGQRLAASLTLGASWGLGGIVVAELLKHYTSTGRIGDMFWAMVPFAVAAGVCSCLLPRLPATEKLRIDIEVQPVPEPQQAAV